MKFRKCPECSSKMLLKRSSKGKFWGCTKYRDGCSITFPYYGDGARAGLDLDIREIQNGFIVSYSNKYMDNPEDETIKEHHCLDKDVMKSLLQSLFEEITDTLLERIEISYEFEDETDTEIATERSIVARRGVGDIKTLLNKMKEAKKRVELEHSDNPS